MFKAESLLEVNDAFHVIACRHNEEGMWLMRLNISCKLTTNDMHRVCLCVCLTSGEALSEVSTQQRLWFWFWFSVSSL